MEDIEASLEDQGLPQKKESIWKAALGLISAIFYSRVLKVIVLLALVLTVGPYAYVQLAIPQRMQPVNYYDFLNSCLLIYLIIFAHMRRDR